MAVIGVATHHQSSMPVEEVERPDYDGAFHILIFCAFLFRHDVVVEAVADISAHSQPQSLYAAVVDAGGERKPVCGAEFVGGGRCAVGPSGDVEHGGVQCGQQHQLVPPVMMSAPQADAGLVPGAGEDAVFTLRAVHAEKFGGEMAVVGASDRHHNMPHAQVQPWTEALLDPELLQRDLAAPFQLLLVFAGLLGLDLHGALHAAMLELYLHADAPAFAEIIAHHDDGMGQVHQSVSFGVFVGFRPAVTEDVVAVEIVSVNRLPVAADSKARCRLFRAAGRVRMFRTGGRITLAKRRDTHGKEGGNRQYKSVCQMFPHVQTFYIMICAKVGKT